MAGVRSLHAGKIQHFPTLRDILTYLRCGPENMVPPPLRQEVCVGAGEGITALIYRYVEAGLEKRDKGTQLNT